MKIALVGRLLAMGLLLMLLGGCAGKRAFKAGEELQNQGRLDDAVARFSEAVASAPESREFRLGLLKAQREAALEHLAEGRRLVARRQYREALAEFGQAEALDPSLQAAGLERTQAGTLAQAEKLIDEADEFYRARRFNNAKTNLTQALEIVPGDPRALALLEKVRQGGNPVVDGVELEVASDTPISLKFNSTKVKQAFEILSRLSGITFIFDEELKDEEISLALEKASFPQALELLLRMNDLGKKVLNSKTIIVYDNSKEKNKQYEDYVIQTFYLSNIDAKKVVNLLRTMLQLRKVYVHEELNALVVRDTPQVVRLAQQIIEAADRSDSEVVLDLELMEVSHNNELKIGPTLSTNAVSVGFSKDGTNILADTLTAGSTTTTSSTDGTTTGVAANLAQSLGNLQTFYTLPTLTYNLLRNLTDSETLANPSIRVKNKEKAKVHIGSREPVVTVTINGDQTSENIQYVDVGVKLDVEPSIQLDNTVVTKVNLEVSNATRLAALESGTTPLLISTTNASTVLVLKDGEQTVIGGLLRDDSSRGKSTIPFLGEIPLLGRLLSGHNDSKSKREILLAITPHIVKNVAMPTAAVATIWSGGEDDLRTGANFGSFAAFKPELEEPPLSPAPALKPAPAGTPQAGESAASTPAEDAAVSTADAATEASAGKPAAPAPVGDAARGDQGAAATGGKDGVPASEAISTTVVEDRAAPSVSGSTPVSAQAVTGTAPVAAATLAAPVTPVAPGNAPAATDVVSAGAASGTSVPAASPGAPQARLYVTGPAQAQLGQEIVLEVMIENVRNLYSAPLFVRFDKQRLTFVRAEEADFLKQGGPSTLFTTSVNQETGELIVGHKQGTSGTGVSGGGKLFRLVFKVRSAGSTQVGFDRINFRDPTGNRLEILPMPFILEIR